MLLSQTMSVDSLSSTGEGSQSICPHAFIRALQEPDGGALAAEAGRAREVAARCDALVSERAPATFSAKSLEQDLARLLRSGSVEQHRDILERPLASAALAGECPGMVCQVWNRVAQADCQNEHCKRNLYAQCTCVNNSCPRCSCLCSTVLGT